MIQERFKFTPREPRPERDRTPSEDSLRRMSEGGKKGGSTLTGSKYDPILDAFMASEYNLVKVEIDNMPGYNITQRLKDRIWIRDLKGIEVSTVSDVTYLEKV